MLVTTAKCLLMYFKLFWTQTTSITHAVWLTELHHIVMRTIYIDLVQVYIFSSTWAELPEKRTHFVTLVFLHRLIWVT